MNFWSNHKLKTFKKILLWQHKNLFLVLKRRGSQVCRARRAIAFWPQGNCFSTTGLACGLHFGRRASLGIAFWSQGNCNWANGLLIDFVTYGLILPPLDWFCHPWIGFYCLPVGHRCLPREPPFKNFKYKDHIIWNNF